MSNGVILRFGRGSSVVSDLIETWTGGWPSHVDFVLPCGLLGAKPLGGVAIRGESGRETLDVWLDAPDGEKFALHQLGANYDWLGIVGCAFGLDLHLKDRWFCSELVVASLEMAGFAILTEWDLAHPHTLSPWELLQRVLSKGKVVSRGKMEEGTYVQYGGISG